MPGREQEGTVQKVRNIADLARLAGVSPGTVSRALAGKALVNAETRARIQALATEHSFRPNQMARRLRTQRTGVIGVVVPLGHERRQHLSDPFFMSLLGHLADSLTENGYDLMLSRIIPDADDWLERIVGSGMLDGVLLIGQSDQWETIERVAAEYRPMVVWGSQMPGQIHCAVGVDNRMGGRLAGEKLIARGSRRLAFLGEVRTLELDQRYKGLCDAAAAAGLDVPLQLDTHLASDLMTAEITAHIDAQGDRIDGIVAASDVIAVRAVRVLIDRGIAVPDRMPITGFDDLPLSGQMVPRLTSVKQDLVTGARAMVDALFARIAGQDAPSVEMTPVLMERDTA
ncbi:LacI family DNA-binding transcriptional regulator [Microvirga sp. SRT01]|uniref:LacI family DNA-binding transcriptional regulator n=1 Tax=Sphingomonas longa TaxID=2778730 RepID=A0ABS2D7W4_9SPHN|nr:MULTISPECIES: LacI family DNA-binding transcriptional regulator [Alphaproteobacteria]MBM6577011.1 LacI family DNA-binding transcriptional regulator [Sphingomonas sp. BT552]MBR7710055.1 LacI family DNA-binding transcriptional regulator [Microvirga sp. SRT01]